MTKLLRESIPLLDFMQFKVTTLDESSIIASAPFQPNRNVHNTGFAGSLYSVCVSSGWALVYNRLVESGANGALVVKEANIRYRKPVIADIECRGFFEEPGEIPLAEALAESRKVHLKVIVKFMSNGIACGEFSANYVVIRR